MAVLVALGSLLFELRGRQKIEAAQIREKVKVIAFRTRQLVAQLEAGFPLIDAAWHTAQSVRAQAGVEPTAAAMRAQIGDSGVMVTAAVEGWVTSSASAELREAIAALGAADDVAGDLNLFSPIAELLRRIVSDGYPPMIFIQLLVGQPAEAFVRENQDDDIDVLTRSLVVHLHGNSSLHFLARYQYALAAIVAFINTAALAVVNLEPRALVRANQAKSVGSPKVSFTEQLREKLSALRGTFPDSVIAELAGDVEQIEATIDKASAEARLTQLQLAQEGQQRASSRDLTPDEAPPSP